MRTLVELPSGRKGHVDLARGIDIGIPLDFVGSQPSAFGADRASGRPFSLGSLILDTAQGGSCNVSVLSLTPHCNGTHTESVRHITDDGPPIVDVAPRGVIGATLITVRPEPGSSTSDQYLPSKRPDDLLITRRGLNALREIEDRSLLEGVIVRTLPNDVGKAARDYDRVPAPYLSLEAARYLLDLGASHLCVDTASVDRADDDGLMSIHRLWFGVEPGSTLVSDSSGSRRTITEMVYVHNSVPDGPYLLNLQIAPLKSDASPSRPVLFSFSETRDE